MAISTKKMRAFTLMETLISLWFFTSICLLVMTLMATITQQFQEASKQESIEWRIFVLQMDRLLAETASTPIVSSDRMIFKLRSGKTVFLETYKNMLRKTGPKGGHEPMLMNVKTVQLKDERTAVAVEVTFEGGDRYEARWNVQP